MGRYENFEVVTREALRYAIAQNHEDWTAEIEDKLITAYSELALYQEVKKVLAELKIKKL
ncbi:hypothetical protein [Bacillus sp. P14.5]|uniref:hypothetical protein n=1 Tax=Bacillus sp. P14.5 TaxID=1983400 RepID=UPI0031F4A9A7